MTEREASIEEATSIVLHDVEGAREGECALLAFMKKTEGVCSTASNVGRIVDHSQKEGVWSFQSRGE